ncbi:hypothetical protein Leryth_027302 [Lithospermum erythrorhizon]|nr:hypothetical protein Leryth_027302 [Lithospermum erythrorhizon]
MTSGLPSGLGQAMDQVPIQTREKRTPIGSRSGTRVYIFCYSISPSLQQLTIFIIFRLIYNGFSNHLENQAGHYAAKICLQAKSRHVLQYWFKWVTESTLFSFTTARPLDELRLKRNR